MIKSIKFAALGLAAILFGVGSAHAGTVTLGSSGWKAVVPDGLDFYTEAVVGNTVYLNKSAQFDASLDRPGFIQELAASFIKTNTSSTVDTFVISFEEVANLTGETWGGFKFGAQNGATFDPSSAPFAAQNDPFSHGVFSASNTLYTVDGGALADGEVWTPGATTPDTSLVVHVASGDRFWVLKEQPTAIPLPAAAWTGLSGLAGLGLVGFAKNVRRLLA
jgi:hypothetical protein